MGSTMQTVFFRSGTARLLPLFAFALVLAGCGDSSSDAGASVAAGTTASSRAGGTAGGFRCLRRHRHCSTPATTNSPPTISGLPTTSVDAGSLYDFTPAATDANSDALTFSIQNKPAWATFSAADGHLGGTPTARRQLPRHRDQRQRRPGLGLAADLRHHGGHGDRRQRLADDQRRTSEPRCRSATVTASRRRPPTSTATPLTFSIENKPVWAAFNTATGALTGAPAAGNVGSYANVIISVSDGSATTSLAPFAITVVQTASGSASLSWAAPTTNSDGSSLSNLAGYRIHYGTTTAMTQVVQVASPGITTYTLGNLSSGTWHFAVSAYASTGAESPLSNTASKTIP